MPIAILVHGGCGPLLADETAAAAEDGCRRAAEAGYAVLRDGGSALDAVEAAAVVLEDDPLFNAGTGSTLNADGEVEMDASIMAGADLRAGAVTLVRLRKNPIRLARAVMERTTHVLLGGDGAERFADQLGVPRVDPASLITPRARARFDRARSEKAGPLGGGTIGAVALDAQGHLAAATSTGGMVLKLPGRIGDTPLIGAGTYADDRAGAASCTGHGEAIIRLVLARRACDVMAAGAHPMHAAQTAVAELAHVAGEGGVILVDPLGRLGHAFNTARMARAWIDASATEGSGYGAGA